MFKLFIKERYQYNYPIKKYGKMDFISRRYKDELTKIKEYYRNKERAVNNSHILNRLITTLAPSITLDEYTYLTNVSTNARLLSKQFDITSNIHPGKMHHNAIFGKGSREILLYKETDIDIDKLNDDYKSMVSLRVVYTDSTDLDFYIPDNSKDYDSSLLNIMVIDITLMLMQYRLWCRERIRNDMSTNPNVFISQIVLPNTIDNAMDLAIWNRLDALSNGRNISEFKINHPFNVLDYSKGIDNILKSVIKDLHNTNIPIEQLLLTVPCLFGDNMLNVLFIGHKYYTKQSEWVLWLSRLSIIVDILSMLNKKGIKRNYDLLASLPTKLKAMKRSSTFDNKLNLTQDEFILDLFKMDIMTVNDIIGVR